MSASEGASVGLLRAMWRRLVVSLLERFDSQRFDRLVVSLLDLIVSDVTNDSPSLLDDSRQISITAAEQEDSGASSSSWSSRRERSRSPSATGSSRRN